ncbi:MAG: hypothetical protein ACXAB2_04595 [Candidatus Hodarchaeales archaeon]
MVRMLKRLQEFPSTKIVIFLTCLGSILSLIFLFVMQPVESELTSNTPYGVLDLEFAWTVEQIERIFTAWGDDLISKELGVTFLDFGFLVSYSLALSGITLLLTRRGIFGRLTEWGYLFTVFPLIAASFDVIENINLILMLTSTSSVPSFAPLVASFSAVIKFGMLIVTIIFWIIGFFAFILKRILSKKSEQ